MDGRQYNSDSYPDIGSLNIDEHDTIMTDPSDPSQFPNDSHQSNTNFYHTYNSPCKIDKDLSNYGQNSQSSESFYQEHSDSDPSDKVTVIFNWNYGGKDVYLVECNGERRKIKMVRSKNCFTTIQDLPKKLFKYKFLVDDAFQYSPDDAFMETEEGFVNFINITNFKPSNYTIPRNHQEINVGVFGNEVPGPNYYTVEPPVYPDILNYRSPDFKNHTKVYSDIHVLSNHIYEDGEAKSFLGPKYKSYMSLYRWASELSKVQCSMRFVTRLNSSNLRSVSFIYVTFDEYKNQDSNYNEKLEFLNYFKLE